MINDLPSEQRLAARQKDVAPLVHEFFDGMRRERRAEDTYIAC
jgi:hypothetical protein